MGSILKFERPTPAARPHCATRAALEGAGMVVGYRIGSVVARVLAGRSVVALTAAAGGFAGGDCVFPDISLVAQVARPLRRMCN